MRRQKPAMRASPTGRRPGEWVVAQERQGGVPVDAREQRHDGGVVGEQRLPQLGLDHQLGLVTLAALPDDLSQLGVQRRRLDQRPPSPSLGAQDVGEHKRVEPVVLAGRRLVALTGPGRDPRPHRRHGHVMVVEGVDEDPVAALDRQADQSVEPGQGVEQLIDPPVGVWETTVRHLASADIDVRELMMGGTPSRCRQRWTQAPPSSRAHPLRQATTVTRDGAHGATPARSSQPVTDGRNRSASGPRRSVCTGSLPPMRMTPETIPGTAIVN
jgi:hypothetical protein